MSSLIPPLSEVSKVIAAQIQTYDTAEPSESVVHNVNQQRLALAVQVQHNLQHRHDWTLLKLHTHSPDLPYRELPRPLLSGLPPSRLYVHPDQLAEELAGQNTAPAEKTASSSAQGNNISPKGAGDAGAQQPVIEQEWVLPTHIQEKWTLRQFADVFDAIGLGPPGHQTSDSALQKGDQELGAVEARQRKKRVLLAILSDDSTVNYYIMHDGIVKPRQN